jgi:hypothetical protein
MKNKCNKGYTRRSWPSTNKMCIIVIIVLVLVTILDTLGFIPDYRAYVETEFDEPIEFNENKRVFEINDANFHLLKELLSDYIVHEEDETAIKRDEILLSGAIDQYVYENNLTPITLAQEKKKKKKMKLSLVVDGEEIVLSSDNLVLDI